MVIQILFKQLIGLIKNSFLQSEVSNRNCADQRESSPNESLLSCVNLKIEKE